MEVTIKNQDLYLLMKRAVSEVLDEKLDTVKLALIPQADDEENKLMDEIFGTPEKYAEQEYVKVEL